MRRSRQIKLDKHSVEGRGWDLGQQHAAIKDGGPAFVRDLPRSGADPDAVATVHDGDSQLVAAASHTGVDEGNLEMVRILLDAGQS